MDFNVGGTAICSRPYLSRSPVARFPDSTALVSSGTSSKTISNEKDMPMVGYGAMVVESLLGIVSLVVVGAVAVNGTKPDGTPFRDLLKRCCGIFGKDGCFR